MSGHVASKGMYFTIFAALMVLTILTVAVTYVHLGFFNLTAALAIAVTKATLVILFFMHVKYSPKLIKVTIGCSFFFLIIMFVMTMSDYISRGRDGLPPYPTATATGTSSSQSPPPVTPTAHGAPAAAGAADH